MVRIPLHRFSVSALSFFPLVLEVKGRTDLVRFFEMDGVPTEFGRRFHVEKRIVDKVVVYRIGGRVCWESIRYGLGGAKTKTS